MGIFDIGFALTWKDIDSIGFWEKMGFKDTGETVNGEHPIMEKSLKIKSKSRFS